MTKGLSVMFLPHPAGDRLFDPWGSDVVELVGRRHELRIFDRERPVADQLRDVDAVIDHGGAAGTREMADAAGGVRLWQILGTGFDHFDLDYWRARGIPVANCPGTLTAVALAELAMMFVLMLARRYPSASANLRDGVFYEPVGRELGGRCICVVGFGASGRQLAFRARAFGMRVSAVDIRRIDEEEIDAYGLEAAVGPELLDDQLAQADVVSLHLHLDATTHHLIDARRLSLMKETAFLVNTSRGALVDEDALVAALRAGELGGAGIDVFTDEPPSPDAPLLTAPNTILTPHIAGVTEDASRRRAESAAENVDRVAAGLKPFHLIS
jgi:phosphoglycerate dehydrogenase-like enzyme